VVSKQLSSTRSGSHQVRLPPGFAHGFVAISETADVVYKVAAPYVAHDQQCVTRNDREHGVTWPVAEPLLSPRDQIAPSFARVQLPELGGGMRVLVTGGAGRLGRSLVKRGRVAGFELHAAPRRAASSTSRARTA
jgi:hypothetical protein